MDETDNTVTLPYGNSSLRIDLPVRKTGYHILESKSMPGYTNPQNLIRQALNNPIQSPPLVDCVCEKDKVVVITTDNTRHCPDSIIVPVILEELEKKIPRSNITIIVALGLHAPLNRNDLIEKLGENIVNRYRVINHQPDQTINLGTTSSGNPVEVFTEVAKADFRISTGFIEPHFFAGFSGGRKSIAPGVSSARAIRRNHGYQMIRHPNARAGILNGNPIHQDMVEQSKIAGLNFIVNVILNSEKQIVRVFAGDPWQAHETGCEIERDSVRVELDRKVDISIVANGGAPLDLDFYQAVKGIDTASHVTRDNGIIIMASSCARGLGPESFCSLHAGAHSPEEVLEIVKNCDDVGVAWQNHILAQAQAKHPIYFVSDLPDRLLEPMMVKPFHSLNEALEKAFAIMGNEADVAVLPEGPLILPEVRNLF